MHSRFLKSFEKWNFESKITKIQVSDPILNFAAILSKRKLPNTFFYIDRLIINRYGYFKIKINLQNGKIFMQCQIAKFLEKSKKPPSWIVPPS
jgi:hypothetical protein